MAIKRSPPTGQKESDKQFRTRAEAEAWAEEQKKKNKTLGMSTRHDLEYQPVSGQWKVKLQIW